jgi:hypothetical protein
VRIPAGVKSIGNRAFSDCTSLKHVVISDGVAVVGSASFWGCGSLENVKIPDSVTSIKNRAFRDCASLQDVTIPGGVAVIGKRAFEGCGRNYRFLGNAPDCCGTPLPTGSVIEISANAVGFDKYPWNGYAIRRMQYPVMA